MSKPKVLVTGASGLIGGLTLKHLADSYEFSAVNRRAVKGVPCLRADVSDAAAIRPAFRGIEMVLHLAAYTKDIQNWEETMRVTVNGTLNVFRAAQEAGARRVVFMSTGSTMCGWEWYDGSPYGMLARGEYDRIKAPWKMLDYRDAPRPDSPYGVGKLYGEAAARWFSDHHDMSMLCIRLGAVLDTNKPKLIRHFPGYLDQMDAVQMIDRCLSAPLSLKFGIFDAISENSTRWRDTSHAKDILGWRPTGTSDQFDPNEFKKTPGPGLPLRF